MLHGTYQGISVQNLKTLFTHNTFTHTEDSAHSFKNHISVDRLSIRTNHGSHSSWRTDLVLLVRQHGPSPPHPWLRPSRLHHRPLLPGCPGWPSRCKWKKARRVCASAQPASGPAAWSLLRMTPRPVLAAKKRGKKGIKRTSSRKDMSELLSLEAVCCSDNPVM